MQISTFVADVRNSIYENVITNHKNIITTFKGIKQLKKQLGEISETLDDISDESGDGDNRRRLEDKCPGEDHVCQKGNNICSCQDPLYTCDCKTNYTYVRDLEFAGCDGQDSDGDENSLIDVCEDRYAPTFVLSDPASFISFEDLKLRKYTGTVFTNKTHVVNFFKYQATVDDDCQEASNLRLEISRTEPTYTCDETKYILRPYQRLRDDEVERCKDIKINETLIEFVNPLYGKETIIEVDLDEESPLVECDFHSTRGENIVEGNVMFHHDNKSGPGHDGLENSHFFFKVTVCLCRIY